MHLGGQAAWLLLLFLLFFCDKSKRGKGGCWLQAHWVG